jgi:CheY-like chemotaxis protein
MRQALVIDDNRATANTICRMLELSGVSARAVYGPRAAILYVERTLPDVVFLDIQMPGVTGFDLLTYFRRDPRFEGIPVVVVTSDDQPETAERARDTGALTTLVKPVTMEGLENVLRKIKFIR